MYRINRLIRKEFAQLRHDPRMIGIMFVAPIIQLIIIGYAATTDVDQLAFAVCDYDHSPASRSLINTFTSSGYFSCVAQKPGIDDLDPMLINGKAAIALVIPSGFAKALELNEATSLQLLVDGTDASTASIGLVYARAALNTFMQPYVEKIKIKLDLAQIRIPQVKIPVRNWFNPELKSRVFMVPAGIGVVLMLVMTILTAMSIVKEREIGTLEQLIVTPIRGWELICGKIVPFILVGTVAETVVILVAQFIFHIPLKGNLLTLYSLSFGFFITTLGLGILVSTVSRTQQQAMLITTFFVMMPFIYLSGFVFPIQNMPLLIQWITTLIPLRFFLVIVRGVFLKGTGWPELWDEFAIMIIQGILIFTLAVLRFKKSLD